MKAAGYIRVSSTDQVDGTSLENQRDSIIAYAKMRNMELIDTIQDNGISGGMPINKRPEGSRLINKIHSKLIDAVIILKLDRGFRDVVDCLTSVDDWSNYNVSLHIIDLGGSAVDTTSPSGRFMLTVFSAVAEMERHTIKERCNAGRKIKKAQGCLTGNLPYGYDVHVEGKNKKLVQNEYEMNVVQQIMSLRSKGQTLRAIAQQLNESNVPTKKGRGWSAQQIKNIVDRKE